MSSPYSLFGLIIHGEEKKRTVCPQESFLFCVWLRAWEQFCSLSLQWPSFLRFPICFLHRKVGGRGRRRLSEVTSLINKLARHTSARRAICSQLVLCGGETEQSQIYGLCTLASSRCCRRMPAKREVRNRKLCKVNVAAWCVLRFTLPLEASVRLGLFIWQEQCSQTCCISIFPRIEQNLSTASQ